MASASATGAHDLWRPGCRPHPRGGRRPRVRGPTAAATWRRPMSDPTRRLRRERAAGHSGADRRGSTGRIRWRVLAPQWTCSPRWRRHKEGTSRESGARAAGRASGGSSERLATWTRKIRCLATARRAQDRTPGAGAAPCPPGACRSLPARRRVGATSDNRCVGRRTNALEGILERLAKGRSADGFSRARRRPIRQVGRRPDGSSRASATAAAVLTARPRPRRTATTSPIHPQHTRPRLKPPRPRIARRRGGARRTSATAAACAPATAGAPAPPVRQRLAAASGCSPMPVTGFLRRSA